MKQLFIALLIFGLGTGAAHADDYPYDAQCRRYNATSETVLVETTPPEKWVLCKFGLNSYIESRSIDYVGAGVGNWALQAYARNTHYPLGRQCYQDGAFIRRAKDSKGRLYSLCVFGDRSAMEQQTFAYGPNSGYNTEMDWALGIH
jgi:hypothetical protein